MKIRTLRVAGPYEVLCSVNGKRSKHIGKDDGRELWDEYNGLGDERGCYLFGIRTGRAVRAAYVGKATKSFQQEAFTADKLQKYNAALHEWSHGTPVMLFVITPKNIRSAKLITDVEEWLIREAKRAWPDLLNKHHTGADNWQISGVTAPHKGRRSDAELELVRMLRREG